MICDFKGIGEPHLDAVAPGSTNSPLSKSPPPLEHLVGVYAICSHHQCHNCTWLKRQLHNPPLLRYGSKSPHASFRFPTLRLNHDHIVRLRFGLMPDGKTRRLRLSHRLSGRNTQLTAKDHIAQRARPPFFAGPRETKCEANLSKIPCTCGVLKKRVSCVLIVLSV